MKQKSGEVFFLFGVAVGAAAMGVAVPAGAAEWTSADVNVAIPDYEMPPNAVQSTVVVNQSGAAGDVNLRIIGLTHPAVGELVISLESPKGTRKTV